MTEIRPYTKKTLHSFKKFSLYDPNNPVKYRIVESSYGDFKRYYIEQYIPKFAWFFGNCWVDSMVFEELESVQIAEYKVKQLIEDDYFRLWRRKMSDKVVG